MANGISKNPLTDIGKVYLTQIAEGSLKSLEKASVLAMSDKPEDQDKAREIKTRFDYQSLMKQKKAKKAKVTEARSDWRTDLREIITTKKDTEEPEIKEKKVKNKIEINPEFKEAVEKLGGKLLTVEEVDEDAKKAEQMRKKEKMMKKRMLMMKLRAVNQDAGGDVTAGYEPEGDMVEARYERGASDYGKMSIRNKRAVGYGGNAAPPEERRKAHDERMKKHKLKKVDECWKTHKQQGYKKKGGKMVPNCVPKNEEVQLEAKYEAGASTYGKATIRNKRKFGTSGELPDPLTGKKITKDATRGELISKRREEHKAKRGVKEEVKRDEYGDPIGGPKISKKQLKKNLAANTPDEQHTTTTSEAAAWTKKSGKNPSGGLNEKGRKSYERENPGSDLKRPSKKVGNKRRASFCARMKGMKKKLTSAKTANDPDSRINKSLRAWNC